MRPLGTLLVAGLLAGCAPSALVPVPGPYAAPFGMSAEAWTHAVAAHGRAAAAGLTRKSLLVVIDFSRPSTERRLWVVDLGSGSVLLQEYVAHGIRSGGTWATAFSNRDGSNQSSLGTFLTGDAYYGVRGLSLRLRGLEPGINDRALARGIVIHGTPNVSAARAFHGRQGRTEGCPAVPSASAPSLVRLVEDRVVVFAWYPDRQFLSRSLYVDQGMAAFRLAAGD